MLHAVRALVTRFGELFRGRGAAAADQDAEFAFHIEMETAENVRRGMSEADARRAALLRFGGVQRFREETSDARGIVAVDDVARDTRFAVRRLWRAPAFAAGVVATLGIGIGAAVGIGTIVHGVLLRDLPYAQPDRLVRVGFVTDGFGSADDQLSEPVFVHFATAGRSFTDLGAYYTNDGINLTDGELPERVTAAMVTPSVLTLLGVRPLLGQLFERGDTSWSGDRVPVLISENLWRRRYDADPSIIGRRIEANRGARTVIGVLPRSFAFPSPAVDIVYPTAVPLDRPQIAARYFNVIGRLHDGATPVSAQAELTALTASLSERFPAITPDMIHRAGARVTVEPLQRATVAAVRPQLILLGVLVAVVLLMATTNVTNLFMLRTERAKHEIAIALSMGASRQALARRFAIEGIVVGVASAAIALPVAAATLGTRFGFTDREIPRLHEVSFTPLTAVLVLGGAAAIGALIALVALWRTHVGDVAGELRGARSTPSRGWRRGQDGLVAFQVAVALVLLVAGGLLGRSFMNLRNARIGFAPEGAMAYQVSLPWNGFRTYGENAAFHARMIDRLAALPGVTSVGAAMHIPLSGQGAPGLDLQLRAGGAAEEGAPAVTVMGNMATPAYFQAIGIPLLAGRVFQPGDLRGTPGVVISEGLARTLFGTTQVIGRHVTRPAREGGRATTFAIIGVAGDVHGERIEGGYSPTIYFPLLRDGDGLPPDSSAVPYKPRGVSYVVRGAQLPAASTIQAIVKELDRRVPPTGIRTLESLVSDATARVRLTMLLIVVAGAAALLLGVIGVYGVVSYSATGRLREFGIRIALGAAPSRVAGLVLRQGVGIVAVGCVAGLLVAAGTMRFLRALLYEVEPTSVGEFAGATLLLVVVTAAASWLPARRAARTHPAVVLRGE